jgi:hypothetical protein
MPPQPLVKRPSSKEFELLLNDFYFRLEERDKWADQTIRYLLYGNGGGIALLMAFLGSFMHAGQSPPLLFLIPIFCFCFGLVSIGQLVRHATTSVRTGRRRLRKRIVSYLTDQNLSYLTIFEEMGEGSKYPSKWKKFESRSECAFYCFIAGVAATGIAFGLQSVSFHSLVDSLTQSRPEVHAGSGKQTTIRMPATAPTLPPHVPSQSSKPANPAGHASDRNG